jgi:hypothetical protein
MTWPLHPERLLRQDIQDDFLNNGMDVAPIKIDEASFKGLIPTVEQMWKLVNGALAKGSFGYTTWAFYPPETRVYAYEAIVQVLENKLSIDDYLSKWIGSRRKNWVMDSSRDPGGEVKGPSTGIRKASPVPQEDA